MRNNLKLNKSTQKIVNFNMYSTEFGKQYESVCKTKGDHSNINCYLKNHCCCYAHKYCSNKKKAGASDNEKCVKDCTCNPRIKSPLHQDKIVATGGKYTAKELSPEKKFCELCCCLLKNCTCQKTYCDQSRPTILMEDLPLYDEKSHLLGYLKKGTLIDQPACLRSNDGEERRVNTEAKCLASCSYADGLRRQLGCGTSGMPRWTSRSSYEHATRVGKDVLGSSKKCTCNL